MVMPNSFVLSVDNSFTFSLQAITKKEVAASNIPAAFFEKHKFTLLLIIFTATNLFYRN